MNKKFILLITPLLFSSCNDGSLFVPSKVFDNDNYERIGVARTLNSNATISNESKNDLIDLKTNYQQYDNQVSTYVVQNEVRDLTYAYFGNDVSNNFKNYRLSEKQTHRKWNNLAKTISSLSISEQETSLGNVNNELDTQTYTFDSNINDLQDPNRNYETRIASKTNNEQVVVSSVRKGTYLNTTDGINQIYGLTPIKSIISYFDKFDSFELFSDNAVYNLYTENSSYIALVSESQSDFINYKTSNGKEYKAVNNLFYEAHVNITGDDKYYFSYFRIYSETLILSNDVVTNTPIIYLEKPALIKYEEITYSISFNEHQNLKYSSIPNVTENI